MLHSRMCRVLDSPDTMTSAKLIERIVANRALFEQRQVRTGSCLLPLPHPGHMVLSIPGPPPPLHVLQLSCALCCCLIASPRSHCTPPHRPQAKKVKSEAAYYATSKTYLQEV